MVGEKSTTSDIFVCSKAFNSERCKQVKVSLFIIIIFCDFYFVYVVKACYNCFV